MKRIAKKSLSFLFPPLTLLVIYFLFVPLNSFTFRINEGLKALRTLPGKTWYPEQDITMIEQGDLAPHSDFSLNKINRWVTDRYGYRYDAKGRHDQNFDVVIIGDSFIYGTGLTQEHTLAARLEAAYNLRVYPLAPGNINKFLADARFIKHPPKLVILESIEEGLLEGIGATLPENNPKSLQGLKKKIQDLQDKSPLLTYLSIRLDHLLKASLIHNLQAIIERFYNRLYYQTTLPPRRMLSDINPKIVFERSTVKRIYTPYTEKDISGIVSTFKKVQSTLAERGIKLLILPIPGRSHIYQKYLSQNQANKPYPANLPKLLKALVTAKIPTVDLNSKFNELMHAGVDLYIYDDSHWNAVGTKAATQVLGSSLVELGLNTKIHAIDSYVIPN